MQQAASSLDILTLNLGTTQAACCSHEKCDCCAQAVLASKSSFLILGNSRITSS